MFWKWELAVQRPRLMINLKGLNSKLSFMKRYLINLTQELCFYVI